MPFNHIFRYLNTVEYALYHYVHRGNNEIFLLDVIALFLDFRFTYFFFLNFTYLHICLNLWYTRLFPSSFLRTTSNYTPSADFRDLSRILSSILVLVARQICLLSLILKLRSIYFYSFVNTRDNNGENALSARGI